MSGQYAKGTTVSVDKSQQEITAILHRYKVDTYQFGASPGSASVAFAIKKDDVEVPIRIDITLPPRPASLTMRNPKTGYTVQSMPRWEQEVKESWRALVLILKANLEAVERGIVSIDQAFMAWLVLPDGSTMSQRVLPAYYTALTTGRLAIEA